MDSGSQITRRQAMLGTIAAAGTTIAAAGTSVAARAAPVGAAINVVSRFGFIADGKSCNYAAFQRLAAYATRVGGGRYRFPPGVYYVARHRSTDTYQREALIRQRPAAVVNAVFKGCRGLELSGQGAVIRLNGRFHRSAAAASGGLLEAIFMPFELRRCRDVTISGFEIDGGVRDMTRDPTVTEAYAYLIALNGCRAVTLRDLNLHHCQTDAILLSDDVQLSGERGIACRDIRLERVRCLNNARGGLAPLQVYGLTAVDCQFSGNAYGTGRYGRHAPGFGVDVEPDRHLPEEVDTPTGNLHFERCQFRDNFSAFLAAYPHKYQGYLRLVNCQSSNANNAPNHMILCWPGAVLSGGTHDLGSGTLWTSWSGMRGGDLTLRDAEFRGSGNYGLFHAHPDNLVRLERIRLIAQHKTPTFGAFPAIEADPGGGRRNLVSNCRFTYSRGRKAAQPVAEPVASFNFALCQGNSFETDLPAARGARFTIMYHANCRVVADRYRGALPGLNDSIGPQTSPPHDTRRSFSRAG